MTGSLPLGHGLQPPGSQERGERLSFFVPGRPQTAGSKRAVPTAAGTRVIESGSAVSRRAKQAWRSDLRDAANRARRWGQTAEWPEEPLSVGFVVVVRRPGAHLRTGRNAGELKEWAVELRPTTRPDLLKLARAAEDALTGVLWADDSQIVEERLVKVYGDQAALEPRAEGLLVQVQVAGPVQGLHVVGSGGAVLLGG